MQSLTVDDVKREATLFKNGRKNKFPMLLSNNDNMVKDTMLLSYMGSVTFLDWGNSGSITLFKITNMTHVLSKLVKSIRQVLGTIQVLRHQRVGWVGWPNDDV